MKRCWIKAGDSVGRIGTQTGFSKGSFNEGPQQKGFWGRDRSKQPMGQRIALALTSKGIQGSMTIPTLRGIWGTRHRNRIIIWVSPGWANAARSWASFPWPIWDLNALTAAARHLTVLYILIWTKNQERFRESWLELLKDNIWRPMLIYQTNLSWLLLLSWTEYTFNTAGALCLFLHCLSTLPSCFI